jgi:hypothetical protein
VEDSIGKVVIARVAVDVTVGICIGVTRGGLVGGMFPPDVDELFMHPELHIKKIINPAKIIREFSL